MEKISYSEDREFVFDSMKIHELDGFDMPSAAGYTYHEAIETADYKVEMYEVAQVHIAMLLYEVQHNVVEDYAELHGTYWIYVYENDSELKKQIYDPDNQLEKDIQYIKDHFKLRFEDLACYKG